MQEIIIRKVIEFFGSITNMSLKLKISRGSIYGYLEGRPIPPRIAFRIEDKSGKKFKFRDLINWKEKYHLDLNVFPGSLVEFSLKKIIFPENIPSFPDLKNLLLSNYRAICVDANSNLIYGLEAIDAAKKRKKRAVLTWRLSLEDLRNRKYEVHHLIKTFDLFERVAIGIALEKFIGKRQGKRTDLDELLDNNPKVQGITTRSLVAEVLGFGSDYVYRQLKKILRLGGPILIAQVRNKKISISKASEIVDCLYNKQSIRVLKKKKQTANNDDYKNRKSNLSESVDFLSQFDK